MSVKPCGTRAAYRRHLRSGEPACAECLHAEAVARSRTRRGLPGNPPREAEIRDPAVPYRYRARRYPWAVRVLAASEARYGKPGEEAA